MSNTAEPGTPALTVAEALRLGLLIHPFERIGPLVWCVSLWAGGAALSLMALAALLIGLGGWLRGARLAPLCWLALALWEAFGCPFLDRL